MLKLHMSLKNDTKTCYRFERRYDSGNLMALYLKKKDVDDSGIDPKKGIVITIEEDTYHV